MLEHDRIEQLSEARIFALAAPVILPIIMKRKEEALARLMQAHQAGKTDTATIVAELAVLSELEIEIKQKERTYTSFEEKYANRK
jgi:uncharacterized protein YbcV (DUF1398 family)